MIQTAMIMTGCATLPYQAEKRMFRDALSSRQYSLAKTKISDSIAIAPEEKKAKLDIYFTKSLFRQSWQDYKSKRWDTSFDLMSTATERASAELREDWLEERRKIADAYATFHIGLADVAIQKKDLKTAIDEYNVAGKAHNVSGEEARMACETYTKQRIGLQGKLKEAEEQINQELWEKGEASIAYVTSQDVSLHIECQDLIERLTECHYQAALRDSKKYFTEKSFQKAFAKANEALSLNSKSRTEASRLKKKIQQAFPDSVSKSEQDALQKDNRPELNRIAKEYDEFELKDKSNRLKSILANRKQSDKFLAFAQEQISTGTYEAAIDNLCQACKLWPDNRKRADLLRNTRIHVGNDELAVAKQLLKDKYPLVSALHCLKAEHICSTIPDISKDARLLARESIAEVRDMQTQFCVSVSVNEDIETTLDASKLQKAIIQALPPASRFVSKTSPADTRNDKVPTFSIKVDAQALLATTQKQSFNKNIRYVSYVAQDPNPDYIQLQANLDAAKHKMAAANNAYQEALRMQNKAIANQTASTFGRALNAFGAAVGSAGMEVAKNNASKANSEYQSIARKMSNTPHYHTT